MLRTARSQTPWIAACRILLFAVFGIAANYVEISTSESHVEDKSSNDTTDRGSAANPNPTSAPRSDLLTVAFLVVAGIATLGLMLVGFTIFWGGRLRRLARQPLPEPSPIDELWYLRPQKNRPATSGGDSASAGPPPPQSPPEQSQSESS